MLTHLEALFGSERKTRWRVIVVSSLVIAVVGGIEEVSGKSVRDAQIEAAVAGALAFVIQVLVYSLIGAMTPARDGIELITPRFPRRLAFAASTLLFLGLIPGPWLEAEMVRRRWKELIRQSQPDEEEVAAVLFSQSSLNRPPSDIEKALPLSVIIPSEASNQNDGYVYFLTGAPNSLRGFSHLPFVKKSEMNILESLPTARFIGLTGSAGQGAIVGWIRPKGMPEVQKAPFFARTIVVSTPRGSSIYLDYSHFKNLVFVDADIEYNGGPTVLENVKFIHCTFALKQAPATIQFADAVMSNSSTDFIVPLP